MTTSLELCDLGCSRGERRLFSKIGAAVRGGQLLRIAGDNGAGKTSLLRLICGLAVPDDGEVRWCGAAIAASRDAFHRQLIYLGHMPALKDRLSAVENLVSASGVAGAACGEAEAVAMLAGAGLAGFEDLPVRLLSQGQRKRVALARLGMGDDAMLWVLDEPFNALDATATGWLLRLVAGQLARGGVVVLTSHQAVALDAQVSQQTLLL